MAVSQATFQTTDPLSGYVGPQAGAIGPTGGSVAAPGGALDTNQQIQADNLAAIASQQQQQPQEEPKKDKSKGWSLTNPFQDIGQIWHDVETHTVAPVFHAASFLFRNLVARPISTAALFAANLQHRSVTGGNTSPFQSSLWAQSWDESAHVSPGQALIFAYNNTTIQGLGDSVIQVDPSDPDQVKGYIKNSWGARMQSGLADAAIDWYLDPTVRLSSGVKALKGIKANPITRADSEAQAVTKMQSPASQAFDQWAMNKPMSVLAEHPMIKGSGTTLNPYRYQMAALVAGAKTPEEINLIRQVAAGIPSATRGLSTMTGNVEGSAKALDKLAQDSPDVAAQVSNLMLPMEATEKWALTAASDDEKEEWLRRISQTKAKATQANININSDRAQQILDLHSALRTRTASSAITNRLAELKGEMKYANTRDTDGVSWLRRAYYNFPVRIYQGLTDRIEGLINHRDDQAVEYARSWLNKSSTLTSDQKNDYLQKYASASLGDRQKAWNDIENDVYSNVGTRFGISNDQMQKILTTTRTKAQNYYKAAQSRAYGTAKLQSDEEHAILPSPDDSVILHPKLITQLEAGAVPMANLKTLENALERMEQTGVMGTIRNAGANSKDTLFAALDQVYGIWKPMSLMTGHRAFNHIGDDFLRSLSKLGALTTVQNAAGGAANFLRNNYARITNNTLVRNVTADHTRAMWQAEADYKGLLAQYKTQRAMGINNIPEDLRIRPVDLQAKKDVYTGLKNLKLDFIQDKHRLGEDTFKIAGSNIEWPEAFGGPNGDWARLWTSSHPTWGSMVDDAAHRNHSVMTAIRTRNFSTISANEDVAKHTRAYVHYIRNQMLPDPVAKQIIQGRNLTDVANWLRGTSQGRNHMKALHIGDADDHVNTVASMVKTYLPHDGMRDDALAGKFNADTIENYMPTASMRPDIHADINLLVHGGDPTVNFLKRNMESMMKWTGTLPDDIMVRHPMFNSLYKNRLTDNVQSWITKTGQQTIDKATRDALIKTSMTGARKDMQGVLYDVSRFNDMGHALRFVSPFFNAWFNAMGSWSKLFLENPTLLGRTYQAKRVLWDSPFAIDNTTGQKANVDTPWDQTSFVMHMPKGLASKLGGMTDVPIDAKTLISPTYIDAVGNPGFGPLVSIPVNQIVKDHPSLMNDAVVRSMLNNMVDKNSMAQIMPSGARDIKDIVTLLTGSPDQVQKYSNTAWSIYQEQYYDYLNGQRTTPPNWGDVNTQAKYLTIMDLFVNRLSPLGFKPAPSHQFLVDEYHRMQTADPKNVRQNFYDKYGPAAMMFTQSLSTDPTGIAATVGASVAAKKYSSILRDFPELGAVVVGPEGNGNFDQMAYDWQVANGLRQKLTPEQAAKQAQINLGWAEYGKARAAIESQVQARGLPGLNDPRARDLKNQLAQYVGTFGDPNNKNYNPDFYENYGSFNQNAYQNRISALLHIAQDPALLSNPLRSDIRSLQRYSQLRDQYYAELHMQKRTTYNMNAATNGDIAKRYDADVAKLMQEDTKFAQIYERYLSKDDWKEPV
ncbi:MAG TPA: hypothetical protein VFK47_00840 [Ktedonobacteraceae bacterium]|nr:hypothetical protein [Ktedonobacteraceae bacterium]